jgi:hypothetical protein
MKSSLFSDLLKFQGLQQAILGKFEGILFFHRFFQVCIDFRLVFDLLGTFLSRGIIGLRRYLKNLFEGNGIFGLDLRFLGSFRNWI